MQARADAGNQTDPIETVTTPFHPSLYIQPNTLLLPNTRVKLHTSFSIVHFHKTKALNPGDNQSILETDIDFFFLSGHVQMFSLSCCTRTPMRIQQRYMHMEWKHIYAPIDAKTALTIQNYLTSHCSVRSISRRASPLHMCFVQLRSFRRSSRLQEILAANVVPVKKKHTVPSRWYHPKR